MSATTFVSDKQVEANQLQFIIKKYAATMNMGGFARESLEVRQDYSYELLSMLRSISTSLLAREIVKDPYPVSFSYKYPSSAWQMFKKSHLPSWFKRRFPVHFIHKTIDKTVTFERFAAYPMADVAVPEKFGTVVFKDYARMN